MPCEAGQHLLVTWAQSGVALQVSPQLEGSLVLRSEAALTGLAPGGLEAAQQQWDKADAYYYVGIARMQRLWEVPSLPTSASMTLRVYFYPFMSGHYVRVCSSVCLAQ